jgi:hypothetical protein
MREVKTAKGSRFLMCQHSQVDARYPKYPSQPTLRCDAFQPQDKPTEPAK